VSDRIALLDGGQIVRDVRTTPDTLSELEAYFARTIRPQAAPSTASGT
jgi:ABC-2 type transport system ATP-binding protein